MLHAFSNLGGLLACVVFASLAAADDYTAGALRILHPGTRATPIAGVNALGELAIENTGTEDDRLLGASSDQVTAIEIHQMSSTGGVMRMRAQTDGLAIPAKKTTALGAEAPGGYHLMLVGVKPQLKAGDRLPVTLRFARAGEVRVELIVKALAPQGGEHAGH